MSSIQAKTRNHERVRLPDPFYRGFRSIFRVVESFIDTHVDHDPPLTFTPGDKLIGDTGEALAKILFNLEALENKTGHDYHSPEFGYDVQVKTTSRKQVSLLGRSKTAFEHIVAFKLYHEGEFQLLYNGPGKPVLDRVTSNSIAVSTLEALDREVPDPERLKLRRRLPL